MTRVRWRPVSGVLLIVLTLVAVFVSIALAQDTRPANLERLEAQIERALDTAPRNFERLLAPRQADVRVLSVDVRETASTQTISIDLSQRALTYEPSGNIEPLLETVIKATASAIGPNWIDRGLRVCNGCKGENRLATRPSVIVEIAYMDRRHAGQRRAPRRCVQTHRRGGHWRWNSRVG